MSEGGRVNELLHLLGPADFVRLAENYGGTRLYVPESTERTGLVDAIGNSAAEKLVSRYARDTIRVPLARDLRARHYRADGLSNTDIARRLGVNETSVDKMFARMTAKPVKGGGDPGQLKLFG